MIPLHEFRDDFQAAFKNQADWRTRKAEEFPDDPRNAAAADLLNRLSAWVEWRLFDDELLRKYQHLADAQETSLDVVEEEQELIREVGFHFFPNSVDEFLEELIERIGRRA